MEESVTEAREVFRFGRFELDVEARELRKDRVRLRLQDQPFQLLTMLLEHSGRVLTREELRARLWPDGTFVDFEHGLNAAVKRLRAALGDNADNPRFVETLHRRGYRFIGQAERLNGESHLAHPYGRSFMPDKRRLAVLPFLNVGDHGGSNYFSEGLTEELITQLGRLCADKLGVVARGSCLLFQRSNKSVREIGEALHVDYLVEGSVRREADRVRITVQLVETRGETQMWADSYERHLSDCFLVQSEVATRTVHSLAMELVPHYRTARASGTRQAAAYQAYLKGRYHWNLPSDEGLPQAISYYEQALALDPQFVAAHAGLARARIAAADYYLHAPRTALEAGRSAAAAALELDATESESHLAVGEVRRALEWDWDGAEEQYRRALTFNPSNEAAHRYYGLFLAAHHRKAEASAALQRACELDPLCLVANSAAAWVSYIVGDYDTAIERCRHTLDMDSTYPPAHRVLAAVFLQLGRIDDSLAELEAIPAARRDPICLAWQAHALGVAGQRDRACALLHDLDSAATTRYVSRYHRSLAAAGLGDLDSTFDLLDEACNERDPSLMHVATEPRFNAVRSDTRYAALVKRLGLR
jgi:TolB-like protein/Tfp pilus assembly protein PilF